MSFDIELDILRGMAAPTGNPLTDAFGIFRDWGPRGERWNPQSEYSPVHVGVDWSARPDKRIRMPFDGRIFGEMIGGLTGSYCMCIPDASNAIAVYFHHCEPTANVWVKHLRGEVCTFQADHGIGAAHLHEEVCVTYPVGQVLLERGILKPIKNAAQAIRDRATACGLDPEATLNRAKKQMREQSIVEIGENYIVRADLPKHKKSRFSLVGIGQTYCIDARVFR